MSFFSVIIPLHNGKKTLPSVLKSILIQNEDIEVIIADDGSTDEWKDVLNDFSELNIKIVETDPMKKHCPGNTRQAGLEATSGEWITFIDHDDEFTPDAFTKVKGVIEDENLTDYCFTSFIETDPETGEAIKEFVNANALTWMHGKFYSKSLIDKLGLHFLEDLETHEDAYFNHLLAIKMFQMGMLDKNSTLKYHDDIVSYHWNAWPASTSRQWGPSFIYEHMDDFIKSISYPYFTIINEWMKEHSDTIINRMLKAGKSEEEIYNSKMDILIRSMNEINEDYPAFMDFVRAQSLNDLLSIYMYCQGDAYYNGINRNHNNISLAGTFVRNMINVLGINKHSIIDSVYTPGTAETYYSIKKCCEIATGPFVESTSFREFISSLL